MGSSALVSTALGFMIEGHFPFFASAMAITLVQVLCAPHRRGLWLFLFGGVNGSLLTTMFIPSYPTRDSAVAALVGAFAAIAVAYLSTPRNPVRRVNDAIEPVLSILPKALTGSMLPADAP